MGQSPSSEDCNIDEVGVPFLQGNAEFGELYPTPKQYCEVTRKISKKGDMLISVRAPVGALNIADQNYGIGRGLCAITVKDAVLANRFCWYLLHEIRQQLNLQSTGSTYEAVSSEDVGNLVSILPSLEEQRTIAAFLDRETERIDQLIARKERQIELLQEKRSALISHAVTKGLNPKAKMKDSGIEWLGEIPEHWEVTKFKHGAYFQEGPGLRNWQFTDFGIPVICVTNITELGIDFNNYQKYISEEEYDAGYKRFTVQQGDMLLSSSGNSWGKVAEYLSSDTAILNTSTIRVNQLRTPSLLRSFIKCALQSRSSREQLGLMMTGACQPNFGPSHLGEIFVTVPSLDEQKAIADYLDLSIDRLNEAINAIHKSILLLQEYRTALISAAVTGKIDVRGMTV